MVLEMGKTEISNGGKTDMGVVGVSTGRRRRTVVTSVLYEVLVRILMVVALKKSMNDENADCFGDGPELIVMEA